MADAHLPNTKMSSSLIKRPLPPFFLFVKEEKPKLEASSPGLTVAQVAKELGRRWKLAGTKTKQVWVVGSGKG